MTSCGPEFVISANEDCRDLIYRACAQQGVRYAMSILRNQSDAEEAVQEAFCRLQFGENQKPVSAFRGQFFVTLRNHCIDLLRRKNVRKEVGLALDLESYRDSTRPDNRELIENIEDAMMTLPENWRQVLQLRVHGELSYQEISEVSGCTFSQVRTWIYRARRQLETELVQRGIINPSP